MNRFSFDKKKWFGYIIFAVLVTCGLLYYRFPGAELNDYLDRYFRRLNPGLSFSAELIKPWPPLGLRFSKCKIVFKERKVRPLFSSERFVGGLKPWPFLRGEYAYVFNGSAYNGAFEGDIHLQKKTIGPYKAEVTLRDIDLGVHPYLPEFLGRRIKGILGGSIIISGNLDHLFDGIGKAQVTLSKGSVGLLQPFFGLESIGFKEATMKSELKNRKLKASIELQAQEFQGNLSGSIRLAKDITKSRLDFKGTIEPFAELYKKHPKVGDSLKLFKSRMVNGKFSFEVFGTVQEPKFKLI